MNWTGGRLQRKLSSGTLGKGQGQRFAKAKLERASAAQADPALQGESGGVQLNHQVSMRHSLMRFGSD